MKYVVGGLVALSMLACTGERAQSAASVEAVDTSAPGTTEPDVLTEADTLGPAPVEPSFRLAGNEPFWSLTIDSLGLRFRTPEDTAGQRFQPTRAIAFGDSLRWNSVNDVGALEAVVARARCQDTMADKVWPFHARVVIGRQHYTGCAERR